MATARANSNASFGGDEPVSSRTLAVTAAGVNRKTWATDSGFGTTCFVRQLGEQRSKQEGIPAAHGVTSEAEVLARITRHFLVYQRHGGGVAECSRVQGAQCRLRHDTHEDVPPGVFDGGDHRLAGPTAA